MKRVFVAFALLFSVTVVRAVFIGADCEFTGSVVNGVITFNQATEEEGIIMDISLTGSGLNNNTWHIHVYSVQNNSCAVTSGHYNPSGYPTYGELSEKFGNIDTSPYVRTFNASENKLSGPLSIVGRSIVIHAATGARIACCTIALRSGASFTPVPPVLVDDDVTAGCELIGAVTGSFTFVQQKVEGQDASTPVAFPVGSRIYVNVSNVETDGSGNGYHIHTGPVGPNGECSAAYTGGHYNPQNNLDFNGNNSGVYTLYGVGELSNKHGYLNTSSVLKSYLDNSVVLTGDFSVAGRSVVIHNATNPASRIACCNITSLVSNPTPSASAPSLKAQCTFDVGNATGAIYLSQPIGSFGTIINLTSIAITNSAEQGPHNYHIHQWGPVKSSQSCSATATGGHYYPDDGIGPDQYGITWASYNQLMEVGDLSGKHGQLVPGVDVSYYDGQVALSGPYSVVGRAIVIHSISGPARIACCTIGLVENFVPPATTDGSTTGTTGIVTSVMTTGAEGLTTESSASSHVTVSLFMVFVALFSLL